MSVIKKNINKKVSNHFRPDTHLPSKKASMFHHILCVWRWLESIGIVGFEERNRNVAAHHELWLVPSKDLNCEPGLIEPGWCQWVLSRLDLKKCTQISDPLRWDHWSVIKKSGIYWAIATFALLFVHPHLYFLYLLCGNLLILILVDPNGWLAACCDCAVLQAWFARTFGQLLPCHLHEGSGVERYQKLMLRYRCFPQIIHFNSVFHYFHHPFWGVKSPDFGLTPI